MPRSKTRPAQGRAKTRELIAWTAAPLLSAAGAAWAQTLRVSFKEWDLYLLCLALGLGALAILLQVLKAVRDRRQASASAEEADVVRIGTTEALQQLVDDLAELPSLSPSKQKQFVRTVTEAGAAALHVLVSPTVSRARINVFHLEANGSRLMCRGKAGRGGRANAFLGSTDEGKAAIDFATAGKDRIWENLDVEAPEHWVPRAQAGYKTFIAVPITANSPESAEVSVYGMISVDAPDPGALTVVELHSVKLVADLLAVAFAIAENAKSGVSRG